MAAIDSATKRVIAKFIDPINFNNKAEVLTDEVLVAGCGFFIRNFRLRLRKH
jgi:hypothetical protein